MYWQIKKKSIFSEKVLGEFRKRFSNGTQSEEKSAWREEKRSVFSETASIKKPRLCKTIMASPMHTHRIQYKVQMPVYQHVIAVFEKSIKKGSTSTCLRDILQNKSDILTCLYYIIAYRPTEIKFTLEWIFTFWNEQFVTVWIQSLRVYESPCTYCVIW